MSRISALRTSSKYSVGRRGTPVCMRCWKYSSGRPASPVFRSASHSKVLPLRGVEQIRYEVVIGGMRVLLPSLTRFYLYKYYRFSGE